MRPELTWTPLLSLTRKETTRFFRVFGHALLIPLVNSTLYLLIFGLSLGNVIKIGETNNYLSFIIPGVTATGVLYNAFQNSCGSIGISKFHGELEDLRISPLLPWQITWALGLGGLIRGLVIGLFAFGIGQFLFFLQSKTFLPIKHPLIIFPYLLLGGLSFSFLGMIIAFQAKSVEQLNSFTAFILSPLMYLGGIFFSLAHLHPFWQTVSKFNPVFYFINGVRYGIQGASDVSPLKGIGICILTTVLTYLLAIRIVRDGNYGRW